MGEIPEGHEGGEVVPVTWADRFEWQEADVGRVGLFCRPATEGRAERWEDGLRAV